MRLVLWKVQHHQEIIEMTEAYKKFLDDLSRAPNATACAMLDRRAGEFGKSVREVCADFRTEFGVWL